jgi:hypothetical protein
VILSFLKQATTDLFCSDLFTWPGNDLIRPIHDARAPTSNIESVN